MIDNQRITPRLSEKGGKQQAKKASQAGFTLVELMVVIAILGILMSIVGGSWTSLRADEQVRAAADKIRSAMTAARMKALTTGKTQYVGIDFANGLVSSSIWEGAGQTFCTKPTATTYVWSAVTLWEPVENVQLLDSLESGAAPATANTGIKTFEFRARGTATQGSVLMKSKDTSVGFGVVAVVNNVVGRVRLAECTSANNRASISCPG